MHRKQILSVALCTPVLLAGARAPSSGGVLLVTIDTLRSDHLGCYGYRRGATPAIDALAKQSAKFEHAFAPAPLTLPSHAALLTGTYPFFNGVRDQPGFRLPDDMPTLAGYFSRAGYATAAVLGAPVLSRRFGLGRGFDDYDDRFEVPTEELEASLPNVKRPAGEVVRRALAWLDSKPRGKPYFLWLHFYDPHLPYRAPEPFRSRFAARPYDGEIAYTDSALETLFRGLRSRGLFEASVIAVTADHGEGLGDHGESTHGYFIYDSTLRVPLLVKLASATRAADVKTPVSLVDLSPTLLHLAGIPVPSTMQGVDLAGSIMSAQEPKAHLVYAETMYPLLHLGWNPLRALISESAGGHAVKYIQAPHPELYDLDRDPEEVRNEYASHQAEAAADRERLEAFVRARAPAEPTSARAPVSGETRELFASLGYIGDAGAAAPGFTTSRPDPKARVGEHEQLLRAAHAFQAGQYDVATQLLSEALQEDPQQPLALDYLGTMQFLRRDFKQALATYTRLLQAAPYYATAYAELGQTQVRLGNQAEAERLYRRAIEMDRSDPRPSRELGMLLLDEGKLGPAEELLQQALKLDPTDVFALNALGEASARQEHYQEAAAILERAVAAAPRTVPVRLNLGFVYLQLQRFREAERLMRDTVQLDPREAQAYALLGAARAGSGDRSGAAEACRRALVLDPRNRMALEEARGLGLHLLPGP